jgi:3-deoxy-7-phosphoheptulonate synthase
MKIILIFLISVFRLEYVFSLKSEWSKNSWRNKPIQQIPTYSDQNKLLNVEETLSKQSPLVFAGECDNLQEELAKISLGQGFLLMGGDCAELFNEFSINKIRDSYRLILQMGMILTYGSGLPTTKIGRMAGQYAKPRSENYEVINNKTLLIDDKPILTYRGDIINDIDINKREPDPDKMIEAYHKSTQTINILRAFSSGGYADVNRIHSWNLDFVEKINEEITIKI